MIFTEKQTSESRILNSHSILFAFFLLIILSPVEGFGQTVTISGKVTNAQTEEPLIGATVLVKGSRQGTITDFDGTYKISISSKDQVELLFSYIGMKTKAIAVGNQTVVNASLEQDEEMLEEVIVVGYGNEKTKESIVGSVSKVEAEDLRMEITTQSADQLLEGVVAGVQVQKESGDIGAPVSIKIRGQGSLSAVTNSDIVASSEPLYILDGVPMYDIYEPSSANQFGDSKISVLSMINPDDIESITVLKDATAAAIYGSNASNGVVLITTKKGRKGKMKVDFSQTVSISNAINQVEMLSTDQYVELFIDTYTNSGYTEARAYEELYRLGYNPDKYVDTNWRDILLQQAVSTQTNLSLSGGVENINYRISTTYGDYETITQGNLAQRFTTRMSLNIKPSEKSFVDFNMGFSYQNKEVVPYSAYPFFPFLSPYNEDGSFNNSAPFDRQLNPVAGLHQNSQWNKNYLTNGSLKVGYNIIDGLTVSNMLGMDVYHKQSYTFASKENGKGYSRGGYITDYRENNVKWINVSQLSYDKKFADKHIISSSIGFQIENRELSGLRAQESNLATEKVTIPGLGPNENTSVSGTQHSEGSISTFGRLDYTYDSRYNFAVSVRQDASSMFGGDYSADIFTSFGASWVISNEAFMANSPFSLLKLRGSYGKTGNSRIGSYASQGLYSYNSSGYNGSIGLTPSTSPNPDLGWENRYKSNLAVDMGFKKFNVTVEYYHDYIRDAISSMAAIPEAGFSSVSVNTADMINQGVELTLGANHIEIADGFHWNSNFNIATNKNEITKLANSKDYFTESTYYANGLFVGKDVSSFLGSVYHGVNPQTGAPQWILADGSISEDGKTANDIENRQVIGKSNPDAYGGWMNTFFYKNFQLGVKLTYEIGGELILPYEYVYDNSDGKQINVRNQSVNQLDRWQEPGDITNVPKPTLSTYNSKYSTRFMYDRTHIKLHSISLGYNFPSKICSKIGMSALKLTGEVVNLGYWYKEKSEEGRNGLKEYRYAFPEARSFTFGLKASF
ncbi:SusC/RagA family TonB-linked outer membrane protein [Sediminitomix flava]|uniref:TonB-linked SusC/RagA family outer membrane protein n=1 Tax=Sediminitomix flava TaxID=379075 RepID=A0A315ZGS6_SEDFL|nr:SusC/RagA family TonB-linked outer membrane protein [Sediminitomix flava]PWJ44552.1 TonB-linked SusC/RagA family outer membrane protein [Sediminitomix flava]